MVRARRAVCEPLRRPPQRLANRTLRAHHVNTMVGVRMACARRAVREPLRRRTVDSTAYARNVFQTLHKYAVE
eukprot:11210403-Lingulodinium_polyedra.AAC.1